MLWTIQRSDSSVSKKKASFKNENSNSNCKCNSNSNSSSRNNTYIHAIIKSNTDSALLTSVNSCKWKPSWHSQYSPGMPKTNTRFLWHCQDSQSAFLEDLKMHSPIASLRQPPARCAIWVKRANMMHTKPSQSNWIDPQPSLKSGVALQGIDQYQQQHSCFESLRNQGEAIWCAFSMHLNACLFYQPKVVTLYESLLCHSNSSNNSNSRSNLRNNTGSSTSSNSRSSSTSLTFGQADWQVYVACFPCMVFSWFP